MAKPAPPVNAASVDQLIEDWATLTTEYEQLEDTYKQYIEKLAEMKNLQSKTLSGIKHQMYRIKQISQQAKSIGKERSLSDEAKERVAKVQNEVTERKTEIREMEELLPRPNGLYLRIILGDVPLQLLNKTDKFNYKEDYEKFKLVCVCINFLLAVMCLRMNVRFFDSMFYFMLVWYYCTLTIRESILIANGSRIKGWWVAHHYISTVLSGVVLLWPNGTPYVLFRDKFLIYSIWICVVNIVQYYYQRGCLYRLRALGERHNMDITVEGFQSWMWKGLTFLLPFLMIAYGFQLYNASVLHGLYYHEECTEWQVAVAGVLFLGLFLGNALTLSLVLRRKFYELFSDRWSLFVRRSTTKYKAE